MQHHAVAAAPAALAGQDGRLTARDYGVPVGWWGWSWQAPVPMSLPELVAARDLDPRAAALCSAVLAAHGSLLVAARRPRSGKTTLLSAIVDTLPAGIERIYLRGGAETGAYRETAHADRALLLVNELSSHLPVYLWGEPAVAAFRALRDGFALAATLHADDPDEAITVLRDDCGIDPGDLGRIDLLVVLRAYPAGDGVARRVAGLYRLDGAVRAVELARFDPSTDAWAHDEPAEAALLAARAGAGAERLIAERAALLARLAATRAFERDTVRAALGATPDASVALDEGDSG